MSGRDLFDSSLWRDNRSTSVFYRFIASLRKMIRDEVEKATATHKLIRVLRDRKKLVRCYTQNIDGLETRENLCVEMERGKGNRSRFTKKAAALVRNMANVRPGKSLDGGCEVVQLHGDLVMLRCTICQKTFDWEESDREALCLHGKAPDCPSCTNQNQDRRDRGKRGTPVGILRPNVVLYGEEHPSADLLSSIVTHDMGLKPDVLLILGTSLKVHGLKALVKEFAKSVHANKMGKGRVIFVNLTKPPISVWGGVIDYWVGMDCDEWVRDVRARRPDLWQKQAELELKVTKNIQPRTPRKSKDKKYVPRLDGEKENQEITAATVKVPKTPSKKAETMLRTPRSILGSTSANITNNFKEDSSPGASRVVGQTLSKTVQLPTPPNSKRKYRKEDSFGQEMKGLDELDADVLTTPSKRRRMEVTVWEEDELLSSGGKADSEGQPVWLCRRRMSDVEVQIMLSNASNSLTPPLTKKREMAGEC